MDVKLKTIYTPTDDYILEYVLPFSIIIVFMLTITHLYMKAELGESRTKWEINKCIPKYMFVSGFIKKKSDENELSATYDNFKECVQKYKKTPYVKTEQDKPNIDPANFFGKLSFT